jgi:hypothetical protein
MLIANPTLSEARAEGKTYNRPATDEFSRSVAILESQMGQKRT